MGSPIYVRHTYIRTVRGVNGAGLADETPDDYERIKSAGAAVAARAGVGGRHRHRTLEAAGHHLDVQDVLCHALAREIPVDHEAFEPPVSAGGLVASPRQMLDSVDDRAAFLDRQIVERS